MENSIEEIHNSFINGQKRQMTKQIDDYGNYDFWEDYRNYLSELYSNDNSKAIAFDYFSDVVISYNRIKNR